MCCLAVDDNTNVSFITNHINTVKILIKYVQRIWSYYPFDVFVVVFTLRYSFVCLFLYKCRHSDSADPNVSKTSRRSEIQGKQDGPKHSERHQERNWQWWDDELEICSCRHVNVFGVAHLKTCFFQDNSFEFEKRRNAPVKYNRDLWEKSGNVSIFFRNCF